MRPMTDKQPPSRADVDFGYRRVDAREKRDLVRGVFDSVAGRYDLMNDLMSLGVHRAWKRAFLQALDPSPRRILLDLASGTGDIGFGWLERGGGPAILTDVNAAMLAVAARRGESRASADRGDSRALVHRGESRALAGRGESRALAGRGESRASAGPGESRAPSGRGESRAPSAPGARSPAGDGAGLARPALSFVQADAEAIPLADRSVDRVSIAFGLRNCTHKERVLREARRVLRPGGRFLCLEFSRVTVAALAPVYDAWSFGALPLLGRVIANDASSYRYLAESIRTFPDQETLAAMMRDAGLARVTVRNMTGGIAAIHAGWRL